MRKWTIILLILHLSILVVAQENLSFGEWVSHLPYQRTLSLTQSPNKVYLATDFSIMTVDKEDLSQEFISKVEGLSSIGISNIKYDKTSNSVVVIYNDSEIDVMSEDGITKVADIKNNNGIVGDKQIYGIHFHKGFAYISSGFGVVAYNLLTQEFGFTTQMGMKVFHTCTDSDDILYAATEDGVYTLDLKRSYNFSNFQNWQLLGSSSGLPQIFEAEDIAFYSDSIYILMEDEVWVGREKFRKKIVAEDGEEIVFLNTEGPELMVGIQIPARNQSYIKFIDSNGNVQTGTSTCANYIRDAVKDQEGRIWYSDDWRGFRYTEGKDGNCRLIATNSIFSNTNSQIKVEDDKVFVAAGGVSSGYNFLYNRDGLYVLKEGQWQNYRQKSPGNFRPEDFLNIYKTALHPNKRNLFLGSFFSGLINVDLESNEYKIYNSENSPIIGSSGSPEIELVSGLAFDLDENLWFSVHTSDKPLMALSKEGNFHSFDVRSSNRLADIVIDDYGYKWIQVTGSSGGVLIYNDNRTLTDPSDDEQIFLNSSNSSLESSTVNCIAKDLEGDIWVGTAKGPIHFPCGGNVFQKNLQGTYICTGNSPTVYEDSIPARLLKTEDIRAIAVDGGNQKWFGSSNGIFVQSPNGIEKVARYTVENSPLFSNNITSLAYDPKTGLMYIGSDNGIQAIKTKTTGGSKRHKSKVKVFPNPVRPDYTGEIAFDGFPRDAEIKITDINGQLIYQSRAKGGLTLWNGQDLSGRKVATGVYLVFSNSVVQDQDPDTAVSKVLIIR